MEVYWRGRKHGPRRHKDAGEQVVGYIFGRVLGLQEY